jgi:hypothetical protein
MNGFLRNRPMVSFAIASIVDSQSATRPHAWFSGSGGLMPALLLTIAAVIPILSVGVALIYIAMRSAQGAGTAAWTPGARAAAGSLRMLKVTQRAGPVVNFVCSLGNMGKKEMSHGPTQGTSDPRRYPRPAVSWR